VEWSRRKRVDEGEMNENKKKETKKRKMMKGGGGGGGGGEMEKIEEGIRTKEAEEDEGKEGGKTTNSLFFNVISISE
jgi:hypothetical protein